MTLKIGDIYGDQLAQLRDSLPLFPGHTVGSVDVALDTGVHRGQFRVLVRSDADVVLFCQYYRIRSVAEEVAQGWRQRIGHVVTF